jgi:hypothetical protein
MKVYNLISKIEFIKNFQQSLKEQFKVGYQHWWSDFIFHYSNINNICSILNNGILYSRKKANELNLMLNDNANDNVISNTREDYTNYARFYFGAKTPTQYSNEGIKPKAQITNNAHCPVPVFLLFDFVKILSIEGVLFSNGNVASHNAEIYNNIQNLHNLEFNYIYDRKTLPNDNYKKHIMYCRQAEVLISDSLDNIFDYLKYICVRSQAEKDTLLYGLNEEIKNIVENKIVIYNHDGLFYRRYLYLNQVKMLKDNEITFEFHQTNQNDYKVQIIVIDNFNNQEIFNKIGVIKIPKQLSVNLPSKNYLQGLYVKVFIDDNIIYESNLYKDESTIF